MASKYELPVWALLRKCIAESTEPMTRQQIIRWFERNNPKIENATVSTHIHTRCVQRSYRLDTGEKHDILYRLPDGKYVSFDAEKHGKFDVRGQRIGDSLDGREVGDVAQDVEYEAQGLVDEGETRNTFKLEQDLQSALRRDISQIEAGL